jgi:periplasmic protein TonB
VTARGRARAALAVVLSVGGCGKARVGNQSTPTSPAVDAAPQPLEVDVPIQYPPRLFDTHVEGDVVLRLFVDSAGRVAPESSRVAQSSGVPALDSAALAGAARLRFAPARKRGVPVAAGFLEPVEFKHPQTAALAGGPPDNAPAH